MYLGDICFSIDTDHATIANATLITLQLYVESKPGVNSFWEAQSGRL